MHGVHYFAFVMTQCAFQIDSLHIVLHLMVRVKLLEFTKVGDEQGFRKLRTSEIKHGRALLAQLDESRIREVSCVCVDINSDECMTNELYSLLFQ